MSDRTDDGVGQAFGVFASLVERAIGASSRLMPRLPMMFEAARDDPDSQAEDDVVEAPHPAKRDPALQPAADSGPSHDGPPSFLIGDAAVRHRREVVDIERPVLVEAVRPVTPRERGSDDPGSSPSALPRPHSLVARTPMPSPEGDVSAETPHATGPPDYGSPSRRVTREFVAPAPESPARPAVQNQSGAPVITTRREDRAGRPKTERGKPEPQRSPEPVVRVSIGRLEIRAIPDQAPARARHAERRTQTLDDYLERRNHGSAS